MTSTPLPALYARWVESILGTTVPDETKASCLDCAMCPPKAIHADLPAELHFRPDAKCCTIVPHMPSFLVGAILLDESPEAAEGRARIIRQIEQRQGATPLGIHPAPSFPAAYEAMREAGTFGRQTSVLCPYFSAADGGLCTIWRHREAVCSTYFCNHVRGAQGARFWVEVRDVLRGIERELVLACLVRLELEPDAIALLVKADGEPRDLARGELAGWIDADDGRLGPETARRCWGQWYGREQEFYEECARYLDDLGFGELANLSPARAWVGAARLRAAFQAAWADPVAPVLCRTGVHLTAIDGGVRAQSLDQPYAPIDLTEAEWEALAAFDGRPTAEAVAMVRRQIGPFFGLDRVRLLAERGVIVPPDGHDVPPASRPTHPLDPDDRIAFFRGYSGWDVTTASSRGADGGEILVLRCGVSEVELDAPDLVAFGRNLVAHPSGFRAGEAVRWGPPGAELSWEQAADLLQALLDGDLLQRLP